jgi:hypothetical protein
MRFHGFLWLFALSLGFAVAFPKEFVARQSTDLIMTFSANDRPRVWTLVGRGRTLQVVPTLDLGYHFMFIFPFHPSRNDYGVFGDYSLHHSYHYAHSCHGNHHEVNFIGIRLSCR